MTWLNHEWLGYAATSADAVTLIKTTGLFYLSVCVAYLVSCLFMLWQAPFSKKMIKTHAFGILLWGVTGGYLLCRTGTASLFFNVCIVGYSLVVLYTLSFMNALVLHADIVKPLKTEDKKAMYAETLLKKKEFTLIDVLGCTVINERILWLVILYRAAITVRASLGMGQ